MLTSRRKFLKAAGIGAAGVSVNPTDIEELFGASEHEGDEPISPNVMVFTHFEVGEKSHDYPGEFQLWHDFYGLTSKVTVPGAQTDVYYSEDSGIAATITGMGKSICTTSVTSILASSKFDFEDTFFVSAGIAGTPPDVGTTGSVFVSDYVVDWDLSHRWAEQDASADSGEYAMEPLPFRPFDYSYEMNDALVQTALDIGQTVTLRDSETAKSYRQQYPQETAQRKPFVDVGTTVAGSEYWHGETFSDQAQFLCDEYGAGTYATTEMEDFGTATALDRHGHLDRYLSIRSVSNFDQPYPGQTIRDSLLNADSGGYLPSIYNVFNVGSAVIDDMLQNWSAWQNMA